MNIMYVLGVMTGLPIGVFLHSVYTKFFLKPDWQSDAVTDYIFNGDLKGVDLIKKGKVIDDEVENKTRSELIDSVSK